MSSGRVRMIRRFGRARMGAAVAAVTVMLLAGCAAIPDAGTVRQGLQPDGNSAVQLDYDILARGPQGGETQAQILQGFLAAAASPQLDYRIAREFLSPDFSKDWKPDSGASVDQAGQRTTTVTGDTTIALRIKPIATVSDEGVYSASAPNAVETRNYQFTQLGGQWRISSAPQGIVLDQPTFGIVFGVYGLEFFSPDGNYLVPDVRWFARRETTQTAIVRALLAGPSPWLAPGVVNAVPSGASLAADTVPVNRAVATVNLALDTVPTMDTLSRIQTQLTSSLSGVSGISTVNIEVNGTSENVPIQQPIPIQTPRVDIRPAVLTANGFGNLSTVSWQLESESPFSSALSSLKPSSVSLGINGQLAAALSSDGIYRVTGGSTSQLWAGSGWAAPTIDPAGGIWATRNSNTVSWQPQAGAARNFSTAWGSATVSAISMSRDGTRLAATLQTGTDLRVVVSAVLRGSDGTPSGLGPPLLVTEGSGAAQSLSWVDPTHLSMLSTDSGGTVTTMTIGGQSTTVAAPSGAFALVAGNGVRELWILTESGELLQVSGLSWQSRASGVLTLAQQLGVR